MISCPRMYDEPFSGLGEAGLVLEATKCQRFGFGEPRLTDHRFTEHTRGVFNLPRIGALLVLGPHSKYKRLRKRNANCP